MKKISLAFLILFVLTTALSLLVDGTTNALYNNSISNLSNSFSVGNFDLTLQEKLGKIVSDINQNNVLNGANKNFANKDSWSYKISDYLTGGPTNSNIYDYQNPVSANTSPYYGKMVVRLSVLTLNEEEKNPFVLITNRPAFAYDKVQELSNFDSFKGSIIIYKPNGNTKTISCYVIKKNGELGSLTTIEMQ